MLKLLSVAALLFSFYTNAANACSCMTLGTNFFDTVNLHNQKVATGEWPRMMELSIVIAEVKDYLKLRPGPQPTEMLVDVTGVIQGRNPGKSMIVQGDDGASCMPYVTQFPKGKRFMFALNQDQGQYYISACGYYSSEVTQP